MALKPRLRKVGIGRLASVFWARRVHTPCTVAIITPNSPHLTVFCYHSPWTVCKHHPMNIIQWTSSREHHPVNFIMWTSSREHHPVVMIPWTSSREHHPVNIIPWSWSRGHDPVVMIPWSWSRGHDPVNIIPWTASREHHPVNFIMWTSSSCGWLNLVFVYTLQYIIVYTKVYHIERTCNKRAYKCRVSSLLVCWKS